MERPRRQADRITGKAFFQTRIFIPQKSDHMNGTGKWFLASCSFAVYITFEPGKRFHRNRIFSVSDVSSLLHAFLARDSPRNDLGIVPYAEGGCAGVPSCAL